MATRHEYRDLLIDLQEQILRLIAERQQELEHGELGAVVGDGEENTLFRVDEEAADLMHEFLTEQAEERGLSFHVINEQLGKETYGEEENPHHWMILDLIDGSREIGADNACAYSLGALGRGMTEPRLCDVEIAVQTELPTTRQPTAMQFTWVAGSAPEIRMLEVATHMEEGEDGPEAVAKITESEAECDGRREPNTIANTHWCWVTQFRGRSDMTHRVRTAVEESILVSTDEVYPDIYNTTGGQLAKLADGTYSLVADLRPVDARRASVNPRTKAHPYDACTYKLFENMGIAIYEVTWDEQNKQLLIQDGISAPFDVETPVGFIAYANEHIEDQVHDELVDILRDEFKEKEL